MDAIGEPNYRELAETVRSGKTGQLGADAAVSVQRDGVASGLPGSPPHRPSREHIFGTDDRGPRCLRAAGIRLQCVADVCAACAGISYVVGVFVGAMLGYFGGKLDILGQRVIEIWSSLPFLYTIIIISSIVVPIYSAGRNLF